MTKKTKSSAIAKAIDEAVFNKVNVDEEGVEENQETQAKVVEAAEEDDDDIFQQDFSKQEKPSKLRILNSTGLERDQKYKGKKVSRKALQSFGQSSDNEEIDSESEEEAMNAEEHAVAELGHMFEMEGVEYQDEDEPGLRRSKGKYIGVANNDEDSDGSEAQEEGSFENGGESELEEMEESEEEDADVERIKSMIMNSKMEGNSSGDEGNEESLEEQSQDDDVELDDDSVDEDEEESDHKEVDEDEEEDIDDDEMGFDLSAATDNTLNDDAKFDTFKQVDVDREISKGQAIKAQLQLWDNMVELRIALQKSLVKTNQLPSKEQWSSFKSAIETENDLPKSCQSNLAKILDCLIDLRNQLLKTNPLVADNQPHKLPRKRKIVDYEQDLEWYQQSLKKWKYDSLEDWNDRTRITGNNKKNDFAGFETSVSRQIEHILADKKRLVKRTQLKRFAGDILGQPDDGSRQEFNEEIFDDDDFYHQLLRELIERKTSGVTDPIALGQQWLQLQKLRAKVKKKVDTRASKGRKTRFDIHAKLINFMAPTYPSSAIISEEAKNELFASLFKDQQCNRKQ
eukprot:13501.XXX_1185431_1187140_1 [CDS] Oithona nana genome sequencing.